MSLINTSIDSPRWQDLAATLTRRGLAAEIREDNRWQRLRYPELALEFQFDLDDCLRKFSIGAKLSELEPELFDLLGIDPCYKDATQLRQLPWESHPGDPAWRRCILPTYWVATSTKAPAANLSEQWTFGALSLLQDISPPILRTCRSRH